jgi:hypothetical protein
MAMTAEEAIADFARNAGGARILSTDWEVTDFAEDLYNVSGSTHDPEIGGNWLDLLRDARILDPCYVTFPLPEEPGTSHPDKLVGGHMTTDPQGYVPIGGVSYLMPLCKWHNHIARNGIAFQHEKTRLLRLFGYMQGEPKATFMARAPGPAVFRLVAVDGNQLVTAPVDAPTASSIALGGSASPAAATSFILFRRIVEDGKTHFVVEDASLST